MMPPSVTDVACTCHYLDRWADEPDVPIEFDSHLNEFHFVYPAGAGKGKLMIYHCPSCGGKAPKSKRGSLFATVPHAETRRLAERTQSLRSLDEVLAMLGKPDGDYPVGEMVGSPEKDGKAGATRYYRSLQYNGLSETAIVHVRVYPTEQVAFWFTGKQLAKEAG